jgi:hypothetical protein
MVHEKMLLWVSQTWRHQKAVRLCGQVPLSAAKKNRAKTTSHAA